MASIWDHDLWQEIYDVQDIQTRTALADLYRCILDMRESDVLAKKIALKVNAEKQIIFTKGQKAIGTFFALLIFFAQVYSFFPHK